MIFDAVSPQRDGRIASRWPTGVRVPPSSGSRTCAGIGAMPTTGGREALLNRFDQFITAVDGLDIHFVHQRSPHADAKPLVITHGWPGSIVEFHKIIEPLTNPTEHGGEAADAFHVICPALPGFGFSGKPTTTGWGVDRIAEAWAVLMARLGYDRYFAQGGDWGSAVTRSLGARTPTTARRSTSPLRWEPGRRSPETRPPRRRERWRAASTTRRGTPATPSTVHPSADPWIWPRRFAGRPSRMDPREVLGVDGLRRPPGERPHPRRIARQRDVLLGDQQRDEFGPALLGELRQGQPALGTHRGDRVSERDRPPGSGVDGGGGSRHHPLVGTAEGGHFAAFEQPDLFVADIRTCFRQLR